MKHKLTTLIIACLKLFLQLNCHIVKIEQIELHELNGIPLINHFPLYFKCRFIALNQKFQILFQRQENSMSQSVVKNNEKFVIV